MAVSAINIKANAQEVINLKKRIDELKATLTSMRRQDNTKLYDKLNNELQQSSIKYNRLTGEIQRYVAEQNRASKATASSTNEMLNMFAKIGGTTAILGLGKQVMDVRNQFQQLEIAFGTMLKSTEKASVLMKDLAKFAAETPFGLQSAASGAKQLLAYGSTADTVIKELTMLGDVAAGTGQQIGDLVYLYGTLRTQGRAYLMDIRQFAGRGIPIYDELAKVLNTSKDKVNEFVSAGKVGFKEVELAFKNMTSQGGLYGGLMEDQSKSIGGRIEALKDNIDSIFNQIGKDNEGIIYKSIDGINTLVENYEKVGKILLGLVATYGVYRTALIVNVVATQSLATTQMMLGVTLARVQKIWQALTATMSANPYVLATTVVFGLVAAIWAMHDATTTQERAQERLNKLNEEAAQRKQDLESETSRLTGVINSETKEIAEQILAYNKLKGLYPDLLKNMSMQEFQAMSTTEQQKLLNKAMNEMDWSNLSKQIQESEKKIEDIKKELGKTETVKYEGTEDVLKKDLEAERMVLENLKRQNREREKARAEAELLAKPEAERKTILDAQLDTLEKQKRELIESAVKSGDFVTNLDGTISPANNLFLKFKDINDCVDYYKANPDALSNILKNGFNWASPLAVELNLVENAIKRIKGLMPGDNGESVVKNKSYWEKQKKDASDALEAMTKAEKGSQKWKDANAKRLEAEKELKTWDFSSKSNSTDNKAQQLSDARLEAQQWLTNKQKELSNEQIKIELDYEQRRLNLQKDSFAKQQAQNNLNYRKELLSIKEQETAKLKEQQDAAKRIYTSENKGSDKGFDFAKFDKSKLPEQLQPDFIKKQTEALTDIAKSEYTKSNDDLLKELTDKYQSFADQRIAIGKKYNDDIRVLENQRKKALEKGDKNQIDALNRSIAKATTDKGKELMSFDFDRLKESPEYVRAFEDLKNTSTGTLNSLLSQLEAAKGEAARILSPEDLKQYTSTIQSIIDELTERNPFEALTQQRRDLSAATSQLKEAEVRLNIVQGGGQVPVMVRQNGKLIVTYLTEKEAIDQLNKAKDNYNKKNTSVIKTTKAIREKIDTLSSSFNSLGDTIGGTAGSIISLIGDVGLFVTSSIEGIEKASQATSKSIRAIEQASVILTIISTAIQLLKKLDELTPDAFDKYQKYDKKIEQINNLRDAVYRYELAVLKAKQAESSWFGEDSLRNLKNLQAQHEKIWEGYLAKYNEQQAAYQNQGGKGWLTGSLDYGLLGGIDKVFGTNILGNNYEELLKKAYENLRIETRKASSGFLGSGIGGKSQKTEDLRTWAKNNGFGDLFDEEGIINVEAAQAIIDKHGDNLVGQTKQTLEELIELAEQYEEYQEQLREYVNDMYSPLVDSFVDSIWDWFDEGKDALDSFKDYASDIFRDIVSDMIRTIVLKDIFGNFQDDIYNLYDKFNKGEISQDELMQSIADLTGGVMENAEKQLPIIQDMVDKMNGIIKDTTGVGLDNSSTSQTASTGYSTSMSQDTGDAIDGRLTAMQMNLISLDDNVAKIAAWNQPIDEKFNVDGIVLPLNSLNETSLRVERLIEENRNIFIQSYYEIKNINKNTKELYPIRQDIQAVRRSLEGL